MDSKHVSRFSIIVPFVQDAHGQYIAPLCPRLSVNRLQNLAYFFSIFQVSIEKQLSMGQCNEIWQWVIGTKYRRKIEDSLYWKIAEMVKGESLCFYVCYLVTKDDPRNSKMRNLSKKTDQHQASILYLQWKVNCSSTIL